VAGGGVVLVVGGHVGGSAALDITLLKETRAQIDR